MRKLVFLAALSFSLAALGQEQNTQGASTEGDTMDPASKARVRAAGAAGGTSDREEGRGARGPIR